MPFVSCNLQAIYMGKRCTYLDLNNSYKNNLFTDFSFLYSNSIDNLYNNYNYLCSLSDNIFTQKNNMIINKIFDLKDNDITYKDYIKREINFD